MSGSSLFIILLCYLSSGISFKLQDILTANFGYVKAYDSIFIKLLQIICYFIMPLIILWSYYSWFWAILSHLVGLFATGFISQIIVPSVMQLKYSHFIVIIGMIIGSISAFIISNTSYDDGYYCAKVHYYNPNTETESNYNLTVQIKNNRVVLVSFPNGGWINEDHFKAPKLSGSGVATIIDDRNYEYTVSHLAEGECEYSEKDYYLDENESDDKRYESDDESDYKGYESDDESDDESDYKGYESDEN